MSNLENMDITAMENLINEIQKDTTVDKEQLVSLCQNFTMYIQNLRQQNRDLQQERNTLEQEKIDLQMQIRNFKKLIFGTKRERTPQVGMVDNIQC